ncbi:MAG TPA: XdhC family protein, partial [Chromatiaceae bacterium]|nr:XdhC family protein [Chromatiaceae bacterium]
ALVTIVGKEGSGPRDLGATMIVTVDGKVYGTIGGGHVQKIIIGEAQKALLEGSPRKVRLALRRENIPEDAIPTNQVCGGVIEVFINVITPPPRLILVGAGHVGKPIADLVNTLGWQVIVVDSDPRLASRQRYPYAEKVLVGDPAELAAKHALSRYDVAVIAYGEVETDYRVLKTLVLKGFEGHIWALCSRTRAKWMLNRLVKETGINLDEIINRLHMPAGLDIGSDSPEEVAISILAEIICVLKGCRIPVRSLSIAEKWWNTYKLKEKKD